MEHSCEVKPESAHSLMAPLLVELLNHRGQLEAGSLAEDLMPRSHTFKEVLHGMLNEMTKNNYEKLARRIVEEIGITEQSSLEGLVDVIYEKAINEPTVCEISARMCKELGQHPKLPQFESHKAGGRPVDLRRLLLHKCQEQFEKGLKEGEKGSKSTEEQKRMLGSVQFIGLLCVNGLITERIVHSCIQTFMREEANPKAEDVECVCKLITVSGRHLETTKQPELKAAIAVYFERMKNYHSNQRLDSRVRQMVKDVLDLRANSWMPRTSARS